jgi:biopolymer transport protein ExbD
MAFQLGEDHDSGMNEMNLIPLIDIMLVLMIIFWSQQRLPTHQFH